MMYLKFCLIQGAYCIGWAGIMQAYLVPLYSDYGYSALQISFLTAIANAVAIAAKPIYGFLCDKVKRTTLILSAAILVGMVAAFLLAAGKSILYLTAIAVVLLYGTTGALGYLIDAWTVRMQMAGVHLSFGETRACGSLCYALFSAFFGSLLDKMGFRILVPIYLGISAVLLVAVLSVKEPSGTAEVKRIKKKETSPALWQLIRQRRFIGLLISVFLCFFASYSVCLFLPLRIQQMGGSNSHYGMALFVSGAVEVVVLLIYRKLSFKFSHQKLLLASFVFTLAMVAALAWAQSPWLAVAMMCLQGIYNGLYLAAIAYYVPEVVGLKLSYSGAMIVAAMLSVAAVVAGLYMGVMITWLGLQQAMMTTVIFALLSVLAFLGLCVKK